MIRLASATGIVVAKLLGTATLPLLLESKVEKCLKLIWQALTDYSLRFT